MRSAHPLHGPLLASAAIVAWSTCAAAAESARLVQTENSYFKQGQERLKKTLALQPNTNRAKNVILFIADGMGVSTITAARIFAGQQRGEDGESNVLTFEAFPHAALVKTYAHDAQVPDSAPTATAMITGVKTKNDVIGLDQDAVLGDCEASQGKEVTSLFELAETAGKSTGVISTARITHATPAAMYAHTPKRGWEADADMPTAAREAGCLDIAAQLVDFPYGDGLEIAFGGGRSMFMPESAEDPEDARGTGERADGRDLTRAWLDRYGDEGDYIWNQAQFDALDPANVGHALGLFNRSHMQYEADREQDRGGEPSLAELTGFAIDVLSKNPEGYVLMVESGRVDHAHHANNAYRALADVVAFDEAVRAALDKVDLDETLIVVTADHSHTLTISGYPRRGNPILGVVRNLDDELVMGRDGRPYTTLGYANGPGGFTAPPERPAGSVPAATASSTETSAASGNQEVQKIGVRPDPREADTEDADYIQQATVPLKSETHAGEDVTVHAIGPWAHLFQGVVEQHYLFHVMDHATKISEQANEAQRASAQ